ncbi:MAG: aromatic amino acid transport family protein [Candidatus Buchananbacteria bacterium]
MKKYIAAVSMLVGTIVGVGMFGLPYVTNQVGFLPIILIYFPALGLLVLAVHLIYGEVCLRTDGFHRLPGYCQIYLGKTSEKLAIASALIGFLGSLLAYLILGGQFLAGLLIPSLGGNELVYVLIFFFLGSLIVFLENKGIAKAEFYSLILLFGALIFLVIKGFPQINVSHLLTYQFQNPFLPYGIILFSLGGLSVIPELEDLLADKANQLKSVIIVGTLIPIITYIVFIVLALGINGSNVTEDALTGMQAVLGPNILIAGFIVGIMATFTSFLTVGQTLKEVLRYDLKFSHFSSWVIACFIPLILYLAGFKNFIGIIGFVGAITIAADGVLVFLIYLKAKKTGTVKPAYQINLPNWLSYLIIILFLAGAVIEIL